MKRYLCLLLALPLLALAKPPPDTITVVHQGSVTGMCTDPINHDDQFSDDSENGIGGHDNFWRHYYAEPRLPDAEGKIWMFYDIEDVWMNDLPPWTNICCSTIVQWYCTTNDPTLHPVETYNECISPTGLLNDCIDQWHFRSIGNILSTNNWGEVFNVSGTNYPTIKTTGTPLQRYLITVDMQILVATPNVYAADLPNFCTYPNTTPATGNWYDTATGMNLTPLGSGYYRFQYYNYGGGSFIIIPKKLTGNPPWIRWKVTSYNMVRG